MSAEAIRELKDLVEKRRELKVAGCSNFEDHSMKFGFACKVRLTFRLQERLMSLETQVSLLCFFLFCLCPPWLSDETDKLTWMSAVQCRRSILGGHASLGQHLQGLGRLHRKQVSGCVCVCWGGGGG